MLAYDKKEYFFNLYIEGIKGNMYLTITLENGILVNWTDLEIYCIEESYKVLDFWEDVLKKPGFNYNNKDIKMLKIDFIKQDYNKFIKEVNL